MDKCPVCGGEIIYDHVSGEYVCSRCGTVFGREYYMGPERIRFEQTLPRTSGRVTLKVHDMDIGTEKITGYRDRKLVTLLSMLSMMSSRLGRLPGYVIETAGDVVRRYCMLRRRNNTPYKLLAAAAIYYALKTHGITYPYKRFCRDVDVDGHRLWRLLEKLVDEKIIDWRKTRVTGEKEYVSYIVSRLNLPAEVQRRAAEILDRVPENIPFGRQVRAAAAVVLAIREQGLRVTAKEVAETIGVVPEAVYYCARLIRREAGGGDKGAGV